MQSRGHEDLDFQSRQRNIDLGRDGYLRRSWSPGGGMERRRRFDDGSRKRSPSPPPPPRGRPSYKDDRDLYDHHIHMDRKHAPVPTRNEFGYGYDSSSRRDDKFRRSGIRELGSTFKAESEESLKFQVGNERVGYPDVRELYSFASSSMKHYGDEESYYNTDVAVKVNRHLKDYANARTSPFTRDSSPLALPYSSRYHQQQQHLELDAHSSSRYHQQQQHLDVHSSSSRHLDPYKEERLGPRDSFRLQGYPPPEPEPDDDIILLYEKRGRDLCLLGQRAAETTADSYRRSRKERIPLLTGTCIPGQEYHSPLGRKVSREDEMPYPYPYPYTREYEYDYERGGGCCLSPPAGSHKETMRVYEREQGQRKYSMPMEQKHRLDNYRDEEEEWIDEDSTTTQKFYDDDHMRPHKGYLRSSGRVGNNNNNNSNRRNEWKKDGSEETEEFKVLVNHYFLSFTKKLNENPVVRRRYLDQGGSSSLFCIVCGRRSVIETLKVSKEFMETKALAMHAYMSHRGGGGVRAQHLGLLKAICVIMGWNTNTIIPARWFPEPLSATQTLAQKQDLIIWPPLVILENITCILPKNNNNNAAATDVGQYLRGIGLSCGKVKLGKPGMMLVKFLGTFSGLQDAEKIHEYFSNKKQERKEVVFGYMGIAQDLDKLDMDTKRKSSIKSKKEIQDIADAPLKPP